MSTNGISTKIEPAPVDTRRRSFIISGLALRLLIAFIISWLIILGFFISGAVSH